MQCFTVNQVQRRYNIMEAWSTPHRHQERSTHQGHAKLVSFNDSPQCRAPAQG